MNPSECFVVMPFGRKPLGDGSDRSYDFDKIYRVVIQRAIREAGMTPVRADERIGSGLIHTAMFRDLRDRPVVLADLSLDNPNVFYELGVRHVMSPRGTVLICRKGANLPFDVRLSRVIFYEFDGSSLDWEEAEKVVNALKAALADAAKGQPDSPVHALLESVLSPSPANAERSACVTSVECAPDAEPAAAYQELVALAWKASNSDLPSLYLQHRQTIFGARALGYFCLLTDPTSREAKRVANHLNDGEQYRLANRIYEALRTAGELTLGSFLAYASSYSEASPNLAGANRAIELAGEALAAVEKRHGPQRDTPEAVEDYAECHRRIAGLKQWRWQLSRTPEDLAEALDAFQKAIQSNTRARALGRLKHPGFLAQAHLKSLILLRVRDGSVDRPDTEGHRDAILALRSEEGDDDKARSYLGWYQTITLADLGQADRAQARALETFAHDAVLKNDPTHWEIGRRQYVQLRRFLEWYQPFLRHRELIGRISQVLQAARPNE